MATVDDVIAVARQLSPAEQLKVIRSLTQTLEQAYIENATLSQNATGSQRVLGLHQGQLSISNDFWDNPFDDEDWNVT